MDHRVLQLFLQRRLIQSHMQRSNGELHLVSVLLTLVMHQETSHIKIRAATSAFLGEAKQAADGIVTFDYNTKAAGAYPIGVVSYMLLETSYANKEKGKAVVELAEYFLSPECATAAGTKWFHRNRGTFLAKAKDLIARANK
jgi:hypothetical protein